MLMDGYFFNDSNILEKVQDKKVGKSLIKTK